jgi:penicillin-binding protein 2
MFDIFGNSTTEEEGKKILKMDEESDLEYSLKVKSETGMSLAPEVKKRGFLVFKILTAIVFMLIIGKLFVSQIVQGKILEKAAEGNKIRPRIISAQRGMITDSKGVWLARNVPSFDLALYPADLPKDKAKRDEIYNKIAEISGQSKEEIKNKSEANGLLSLDLIILKENLSHDEALLMEEKTIGLQGLTVVKRARREYKSDIGLSHLLGYTGKISSEELKKDGSRHMSDWIGKAGLESFYEQALKGQDGIEQIEVDSTGNVVRVLADSTNREPITGNNLSLYLDTDLQQKTYEYLKEGMDQAKSLTGEASGGAIAIAMNPQNGGILSMVSIPSYDDNLFAQGISNEDYTKLINDPTQPMFNRATSGEYPPGSTIKIVHATAGLSEGAITENTAFDTPVEITVGDWIFPDWKDHGYTDIRRAIAESNNVFFYSIGGGYGPIKGIGIDNLKKWWQKFGLGEGTGIDLSSESSGLLPDPEWKEKVIKEPWYIGDTYHVSIGQGDLLVTPLQMVRATAAIANGGKLLHPTLVQKITDPSGNVIKELGNSVENPQVADPNIIKIVQEGMRMAVTSGSASQMQDLPIPVAGKTGTAQFFNNAKTHAWFECYAPSDNPQIALVVIVEGGGGGHEIALPVAKNILNYYFTR